MATLELVRALKELGLWGTKDDLMREVIPMRPSNFSQLTDEDAFRIISCGNDIVMSYGKSPVYIEPLPISDKSDDGGSSRKETVGRCVDLWKSDDILSDTPKRRPRGFDTFNEPFLDGGILPPDPTEREQYFSNISVLPIGSYPTRTVTNITKIKAIGSDEIEEVES
jgi:hypothetical protein